MLLLSIITEEFSSVLNMGTEFFFITFQQTVNSLQRPLAETLPNPTSQRWQLWTQIKPLTCFLDHLGKEALAAIKKAMREFHKRSCVKFVPRTNEQDYIEFEGNLG